MSFSSWWLVGYIMIHHIYSSSYYIFWTGQAKSFPSGLKMKVSPENKLSRARATCDGPFACERDDAGGCDAYGPSNQAQTGFLPVGACRGQYDGAQSLKDCVV